MFKSLIIAFAVLGVALAGRIAREEPQKNELKDFIEGAQKTFDDAKTKLAEIFQVDLQKTDLTEVFKGATKDLVDKLEGARASLDKELKAITNKTVADFYGEVDTKIQTTIADLKKQVEAAGANPDVQALRTKFEEGVNTLIQEGKKVADATKDEVNEAQKKLRVQTQALVDQSVKALKDLQEKAAEAVKKD